MNRFLKILLIVVGVVAALLVVAAIALPLFFDPNDYKDQITAAVEEETGREMAIPGDIQLTVFPWLGVELGEVRLANAQGFGDKPFAEIGSAGVRVRLLPLLSKRIEIGTVTLTDARLRLARKADGTTNWDDLVEAFSAEEATAKPEEPPAAQTGGGFTVPDLEVGAVEINNAAVTWDDGMTGQRYELTKFNLSTGRLRSGQAFPLEMSFVFAAEDLGITTETKLVAEIEPDLEAKFVRLPEFRLDVIAQGGDLPKGKQQFTLTGNGNFDAEAGRMKVQGLKLQTVGVTVTGEVDGNELLTAPKFNGRVTVEDFSPRALMQRLGVSPPETQDAGVLTSAGLDAQFQATTDSASLQQVLIKLDDSTLKGKAGVSEFANPMITFQMDLDKMNVDRYLPPETDGGDEGGDAGAQDEGAVTSGPGGAEIDLGPLRDLRMDGRLNAGELRIVNLKVENAELAVTANNGVLRIQPLGADLYGGNMRLQSTVDAAQERPSYRVQGNLNALHLGPLLKDLVGTDKLSALANLTLDLTTSGITTAQMLRSLDGRVSVELRDGVLSGVNLADLLAAARNRFSEQGDAEDVEADGETDFSRLAASFSVNNGVLSGKDLSLSTDSVQAKGAGSYNLPENRLDYVVNVAVPESSGGELSELSGLTVPIKLSGELFSPSFSIDMGAALKGLAQQRLQEEKAELQEKVQGKVQEKRDEAKKKVQDELKEGLSNLFGGSDDKKEEAEQPQ